MRIVSENPNLILVSPDGNHTLKWSVAVFKKTRFSSVDDPFREVNSYWESLPLERQQRLWIVYQRIWNIFRDHKLGEIESYNLPTGTLPDVTTLIKLLEPEIKRLYDLMPLHEIDNWLNDHGSVKYPDNLKVELDSEDISIDKTYLKEDYHGLVILTTALRPMVPIWGEFVNIINKEAGTAYKEYSALRLLFQSYIVTCEPMVRLQRYIEASITREVDTAAAVVDRISTSDIPDWLLGLVVVRRMALGEVDADDERGNIISNIYGFIYHTLKELDKKFGGVKEKYPENRDEDGEDGSKLEFFKMKEAMTAGDRASFIVYTENTDNMRRHVDPTIPKDLVEACLEGVRDLATFAVEPVRIKLIQIVMQDPVSAGAIPNLSKVALIDIMGVAQAALIHWGFDRLAVLLTALPYFPEDGSVTVSQGRSKIPQNLVGKLGEIFPYTLQDGGNRQTNIGVSSIQAMIAQFNDSAWQLTTSVELFNSSKVKLDSARCISLQESADQPTLAAELAMLVIKTSE